MSIIENEHIRAEYNSSTGKISSFYSKQCGTEWLWQCIPSMASSGFDDQWNGGIDIVFPSDEPWAGKEDDYPDHGYCWDAGWRIKEKSKYGFCIEKANKNVNMKLKAMLENKTLLLKFTAKNISEKEFPYMFRWHPAFSMDKIKSINFNADKCFAEKDFFSDKLKKDEFIWPNVKNNNGSTCNLSNIPAYETGLFGMCYSEILSYPIILKSHNNSQLFIESELPWMCLFFTKKGWRNYSVLVPEPATGMFCSIEKQYNEKIAPVLKPKEKLNYKLLLTV